MSASCSPTLAVMVLFKTVQVRPLERLASPRTVLISTPSTSSRSRSGHGQLDLVYQFETLVKLQQAFAGSTSFMPWTYPPQFDLLVAPFALLPAGIAYLLFITATLTAYLLTLRAVAGSNFALVLVVLFPALAITIGFGQNGFLSPAR